MERAKATQVGTVMGEPGMSDAHSCELGSAQVQTEDVATRNCLVQASEQVKNQGSQTMDTDEGVPTEFCRDHNESSRVTEFLRHPGQHRKVLPSEEGAARCFSPGSLHQKRRVQEEEVDLRKDQREPSRWRRTVTPVPSPPPPPPPKPIQAESKGHPWGKREVMEMTSDWRNRSLSPLITPRDRDGSGWSSNGREAEPMTLTPGHLLQWRTGKAV